MDSRSLVEAVGPVTVSIALIGARGSGKSTVGSEAARTLGRPFVDLDAMALAITGADSVTAVFEQAGVHAWRQAEAAALEAVRASGAVIATGGGVPAVDPPRHVLEAARGSGEIETLWLRCSIETLQRRLRADPGDRPSLTGEDPVLEASAVAASRAEDYRRMADGVIDADGDVGSVVQAVVAWIGRREDG
ncbi:MAG: shikimate kinase [Phycisphaerales bacterium]|nr:shikimate kinase [Phycisphaerales bacterium]